MRYRMKYEANNKLKKKKILKDNNLPEQLSEGFISFFIFASTFHLQ